MPCFVPPPRLTGRWRHSVLDLSVRPSVRSFVAKHDDLKMNENENEMKCENFDANWHNWSTGQGMKRSTLGARSKVKVT